MQSRVDSDKLALAAGQHKREREYWLEKLSGDLVKTAFPFDHPPGGINRGRMNRESETFEFPPGLLSDLMRLSKGADVKLHMILAAGLFLLLNKYTGNEDIVIGSPILKQEAGTDFINTVLVFRNPVKGDGTFKELLLQVRETIIAANKNQNYPLEKLFDQLNIPAGDDEFPLFDVVLLLENLHDQQYIKHIHYNTGIFFVRSGEAVKGVLHYYSPLYRESTAKQIIRHYMHLLEQALRDLDGQISGFEPLSPEEKRQVLVEFNRGETAYPKDGLLHRLFEAQAERTPHRIALVGPAFEMTGSPVAAVSYDLLNQKADGLAHLLKEKGVGPESIVALMVEPSVEMPVGILAILKAGGAYLPIDPDHPRERIKYMLSDSGAGLLLNVRDGALELTPTHPTPDGAPLS
ncbi:MAG: AMP-binding protein, partial [bacterium]|nr:AMP-binding protein [bacterium]